MDAGEFGTDQVKKEVDHDDFNEDFQRDVVKDIFSECGVYDNSSETDFVDKPEYVDHSEVCEDISTNEPNTEQIKSENDFEFFYDDIKLEIVEENLYELSRFCEVCNNSFSNETAFIDSKINKFECSCQNQNDVKLPLLGLTSDSGLDELTVVAPQKDSDNKSQAVRIRKPRKPKKKKIYNFQLRRQVSSQENIEENPPEQESRTPPKQERLPSPPPPRTAKIRCLQDLPKVISEERSYDKERARLRASQRVAREDAVQRDKRLEDMRIRALIRRATETVGEREQRLQDIRRRALERRASESVGQREKRLENMRRRTLNRRATDSNEQLEERLEEQILRVTRSRAALEMDYLPTLALLRCSNLSS